jgi:Integrase core domain
MSIARSATIGELQAALDRWVGHYNTERPHQSLGMRPPAQRFALATGPVLEVVEPVAAVARDGQSRGGSERADLRSAGVQRWVDQRGLIRLAGFGYRVPIVLAGEPVEAIVADNLVQIYHRDVLVASHAQRQTARQHAAAAASGQTHCASGYQRDRGDQSRRQQRGCVFRRDDVSGRKAMAGKTG